MMANSHYSDIQPNPRVQEFAPGDTVKVNFKVKEGERERLQAFQGVVIKKRGGGAGATFTVRRVTYAIGVERVFPLHSPLLDSVEVLRKGDVRRAKLYYLRGLTGKASRIKEKGFGHAGAAPSAQEVAEVVQEEGVEAEASEGASSENVAEVQEGTESKKGATQQ